MPLNDEVNPAPAAPDPVLAELQAVRALLQELVALQVQQAQHAQSVRSRLADWDSFGLRTVPA